MCKCVSYRYLIPVNADALYAFKNRGLGTELGQIAPQSYKIIDAN